METLEDILNPFNHKPNNKTSNSNLLIFPGSEDGKIKQLKISLNTLNEIQKKVVTQALKMLLDKRYIYIFGGGHGASEKTNFCHIVTLKNVKKLGAPTRLTGKLSYDSNPEFYDNLDWGNKKFYYGIDCSGFIYACYNLAGFKIKCSLAKDYVNNKHFKIIKNEDLKAGDIVSFPNLGHVIMFLAFKNNINGELRYYCIHEPSSGNFLKTGLHKLDDGIPLTYCD